MDFFNHLMSGYTPILIFIFLCFAALMIFFIKLSRNLEALIRVARYDRTALMDQLAVMQNSLEDLVRYQSDTYNFFQSLYQDDTSTPIEESDQPYAVSEEAYAEPDELAYGEDSYATAPSGAGESGSHAAGAAIAGAAAGLAAGAFFDDRGQDSDNTAFEGVPDLSGLVDDEELFPDSGDSLDAAAEQPDQVFSEEEFDLTLGDTIPPKADPSAAAYESMAEETMEFNDTDYAHYSSALAEKQAKEDFSITPELDDLLGSDDVVGTHDQDSPIEAENDLILDGMDLDFSPEDDDQESGLGDFTLDLDAASTQEADLQEQDIFLDAPEALADDDLLLVTEDSDAVTDVSDLDLSLDSVDDAEVPGAGELEFALDEPSAGAPEKQAPLQDDLPELNFHEEPESEISMALDEDEDSIYLLDEPLTSDEESTPSEELQDFELSDLGSSAAPVSVDEELDMDLISDTVREPAIHEVVSDDALDDEIVMDFPLEEEQHEFDTEFDVEPQHIDLDFQLEDESESDQGLVLNSQEEEFAMEDDEDDDGDDDVIISEEDEVDEDDSDLDLLVDNLLDVPEEVNLDVDAEDSPDFETAIVIDDDDDEVILEDPVIAVSNEYSQDDAADMLPEADLSDDDLLLDGEADVITNDEELTFDFDKPQFSAAKQKEDDATETALPEAEPNEEISTQDMMLTLDETIELDHAAAAGEEHEEADDAFPGSEGLLDDKDDSPNEFLLDGLMDLPGPGTEHGFSFGGDEQDDPFSLQDLDITIVDQEDSSISLETDEADAAEDDIVLPDVSFKTLPDADADAVPHEDLLELETDELVEESAADAGEQPDGETKKKSANILDFIIDD